MSKNQSNGDSFKIVSISLNTNERGKIINVLTAEKTNEIIDEIVITAGYHQIKEEIGKIVRIDKNGTVLDQLTEERYNKIKRKADQNKLHENEGR